MSDNETQAETHRTQVPILYADEWIVAVDKPSGMFVHRSEADRSATEFVVQNVRDQLGHFVYPVHRLDRPTSGVLLLAKDPESAAMFAKMFAERQIRKIYLALVRGFTDESGTITRKLVPSKGRGDPTSQAQSTPKEAETDYRTLERFEIPLASDQHTTTRCSLVEAKPKTGRYHQIRRHLCGIAHPIIGDSDHGDTKLNRLYQKHLGVTRLMLASVRVEFVHPITNDAVTVECAPAESFANVVKRLRGESSGSQPEAKGV